jgi:hypothetical protein
VINIKSATEIFKLEEEPFILLEKHLYFVLEDIRYKLKTRQITVEEATKRKLRAFASYNDEKEIYERRMKAYQECIDNILKTEILRAKLRKDMTLENALELIKFYSRERWDLNV